MTRKLKPDQVSAMLNSANVHRTEREIQHGMQYCFDDGAKLNVFTSGKRHWNGDTNAESVKEVEGVLESDPAPKSSAADEGQVDLKAASNKVFIVYGHDAEARNQLELMLRRFKLEPVVLQNMTTGGQTIIEKLEGVDDVRFAIVLLTPDDQGHKSGEPNDVKPRARQNVVLELGMFLSSLGRKRVAILHKGDLELPSDINGLLYIPFNEDVSEVRDRVAAELQEAGFDIQIKDLLT